VDRLPRLYRAYLMYAANDSAAITALMLTIIRDVRTYTVAIPQTYTGTGNAAAGDFRLYDLGDFYYPRPGVSWANYSGGQGANSSVVVTHSTSTNRRVSIGGVLLIPAHDGSAIMDAGVSGFGDTVQLTLYTHGSAPRVAVNYAGDPQDLTTWNTTGLLLGGNIKLVPAVSSSTTQGPICNRLSILMLRARSSTNDRVYTFNAQDTYSAWVEYSPRYLYGFV
jgi:hypothetical protein